MLFCKTMKWQLHDRMLLRFLRFLCSHLNFACISVCLTRDFAGTNNQVFEQYLGTILQASTLRFATSTKITLPSRNFPCIPSMAPLASSSPV